MKKENKKPDNEALEELGAQAVEILEKFGLKDEKKMVLVGKILILGLLLFEAIFITVQLLNSGVMGGRIIAAICLFVLLIASEAITLFVVKKNEHKQIFYIVSALSIFFLVGVTRSSYVPILYILFLTELYLNAKQMRTSVIVLIVASVLYVVAYLITSFIWFDGWTALVVWLPHFFEALVYFAVHFVGIHFLLVFYHQYLRLTQVLKDLDESNERLKEAYDELAEVTALEERQRIAKEIHDTAGHSMTTVIMQTEAAKLIIEQDPQSAKQKIVAANLQAKHALEELRESVHLLSGSHGKPVLKTALLQIIAESTDGTDVVIRHDVDDVEVDDKTYRYICNTFKEGIANGLRHGGASAFYFELKNTEDGIDFLLSDNGMGRESGKLKKGFGLTGMVREAKALGGSIAFYTQPEEGFEIRLQLPIQKEKTKEKEVKNEN
ncbi:MAG: hypothetical protein IKC37_02935 [Clostridia bacterium]|nr:hypothetical protein [Clostridia bacterium]